VTPGRSTPFVGRNSDQGIRGEILVDGDASSVGSSSGSGFTLTCGCSNGPGSTFERRGDGSTIRSAAGSEHAFISFSDVAGLGDLFRTLFVALDETLR